MHDGTFCYSPSLCLKIVACNAGDEFGMERFGGRVDAEAGVRGFREGARVVEDDMLCHVVEFGGHATRENSIAGYVIERNMNRTTDIGDVLDAIVRLSESGGVHCVLFIEFGAEPGADFGCVFCCTFDVPSVTVQKEESMGDVHEMCEKRETLIHEAESDVSILIVCIVFARAHVSQVLGVIFHVQLPDIEITIVHFIQVL